LEEALKVAGDKKDVDTKLVSLYGKNINGCQHCNWCLRGQKKGQFCHQKDDMNEIYPLILEADGLVLASPVYFGRLSGHLANFVDRLRVFVHGNYYGGKLKDKAGSALAASWFRAEGEETTLLSINYAFWRLGMLTTEGAAGLQGAAGVSTVDGTGKFDSEDKLMVLKDE